MNFKKITPKQIKELQRSWAETVLELGKFINKKESMLHTAELAIKNLYAYEFSTVAFKPTQAREIPFRNTPEGAISYFIGGNPDFPEDQGFALKPWKQIYFENAILILEKDRAFAMGNYFFSAQKGDKLKVEYTFGYRLCQDQKLRIDIHHSSIPFPL